jgi:RND family efflux transporter MFP subunit
VKRRSARWLGWSLTLSAGVAFAVGLTWLTRPFRVDDGDGQHLASGVTRVDPSGDARPDFVGVVVSRAAIDLTPRIEAKVESVLVKVGDQVQVGQLLARLESEPIKHDLALARATLKGVRAGANRAQIAMLEAREKSQRRLAVASELSREEVESAQSQAKLGGAGLSEAQAAVAEQQARIAKLEEMLAYTELRAPFAGKIAAVYAVTAASVGTKTPVLRLVQNEELCVRFAVPAKQMNLLQVGKPVRFSLETVSGELPGKVESISPEVDPGSQMGYVEASLDLPKEARAKIQPGLVARVRPPDDAANLDNRHAWQETHP